jgi:hypothetical protein
LEIDADKTQKEHIQTELKIFMNSALSSHTLSSLELISECYKENPDFSVIISVLKSISENSSGFFAHSSSNLLVSIEKFQKKSARNFVYKEAVLLQSLRN